MNKNIKVVCVPKKRPTEVEYKDLIPKLSELLKPKNFEVLVRVNFNSRNQDNGESVSAFELAIHELSQSCNFFFCLNLCVNRPSGSIFFTIPTLCRHRLQLQFLFQVQFQLELKFQVEHLPQLELQLS